MLYCISSTGYNKYLTHLRSLNTNRHKMLGQMRTMKSQTRHRIARRRDALVVSGVWGSMQTSDRRRAAYSQTWGRREGQCCQQCRRPPLGTGGRTPLRRRSARGASRWASRRRASRSRRRLWERRRMILSRLPVPNYRYSKSVFWEKQKTTAAQVLFKEGQCARSMTRRKAFALLNPRTHTL